MLWQQNLFLMFSEQFSSIYGEPAESLIIKETVHAGIQMVTHPSKSKWFPKKEGRALEESWSYVLSVLNAYSMKSEGVRAACHVHE